MLSLTCGDAAEQRRSITAGINGEVSSQFSNSLFCFSQKVNYLRDCWTREEVMRKYDEHHCLTSFDQMMNRGSKQLHPEQKGICGFFRENEHDIDMSAVRWVG